MLTAACAVDSDRRLGLGEKYENGEGWYLVTFGMVKQERAAERGRSWGTNGHDRTFETSGRGGQMRERDDSC
ncbi:hypothetical protein Hypma_008160 [Hypsizygus marmoreus]|uniref:Uncharacterized protein n=1 Tax=Hypsizygus marmoreus TaxID=39966 RepID=A0A369JS29_HYPMA|nr:hypothetical protein Hypma_008160 [Hypsizygus marmoreus]